MDLIINSKKTGVVTFQNFYNFNISEKRKAGFGSYASVLLTGL